MPELMDAVPLIDVDDAALLLGTPPDCTRIYLEAQDEPPVAIYHGKPLWLSDTIHDLIGTGT